MIYTVTLNPSIDYVVKTEHFLTGGMNRAAEEHCFPGGKGINVSVMLKRLGVSSTALGFTAGFTGREVEAMLEKEGIETDFIRLSGGNSRINIKLKSEEETEINGRGPQVGRRDLAKLYKRLERLHKGDDLVLSGSSAMGTGAGIYGDIMEALPEGIRVYVDAEKNLLLPALSRRPFLIKPNRKELEECVGISIRSREAVRSGGKILQELGARNVLISLAGEGAVLITEDGQILDAAAPKGKVQNSAGAGDSMLAGFLASYDRKQDIREAFIMGIAAGSASAFSLDLADRKEVEETLKLCYNLI